MKHLLFASLFLLFSCYIFTQAPNKSTIVLNKKEFISKKERKYVGTHHFNANIAIGGNGFFLRKEYHALSHYQYFHINTGYRILSKEIISPEVGLGLLVHYDGAGRRTFSPFDGYDNYIALNYMSYIKAGFNVQTRRKLAFVGDFFILRTLSLKGGGLSTSAGLKYNISDKIVISLSLEIVDYAAKVWGWTKTYNTFPLDETIYTKGLHYSNLDFPIYGIKLGIHF